MAKENNEFVDQKPSKESYVFYYSWYVWLSTLNAKTQLKAFKVMCEYALYDIQIPRDGFTLQEYTTLLTFKKNIDANKRNYVNGIKGGSHGGKGGRPKAQEVSEDRVEKTPPGFSDKKAKDSPNGKGVDDKGNEEEEDKDNGDETGSYSQPSMATPSFSYIYKELMPTFFFRNCNAKYEVRRFYEFYSLANWRLSGGDQLDTREALVVAATRWKVEDTNPYFPLAFVSVWKDIYGMAPEELKYDALEISSPSRMQTGITIVCSLQLHQWLTSPNIKRRVDWLLQTKLSHSYRLDFVVKKATNMKP